MTRTIPITLSVILASASLVEAQYYPQYYPPSMAPADPQTLVNSWYLRYLHRNADPGAAGWVQSLRRGHSPEEVLATILSSDEYYLDAGNTPFSFIRQLYIDLFGRQPSAQEVGYWLRRLRFDSRKDIAYQLLTRYPQNWQGNGVGYTPGYYPDPAGPNFPDPSGPYFRSYEYRRALRGIPPASGG
jgi:hypothetical protein